MAISTVSAISSGVTTLGNIIAVTPQSTVGYQPQNTQINGSQVIVYNQPAILFHYEGENTSTIESDITDHYVEDNTPVQDHIALKPVIITTQGFIGELNDIPPNAFFQAAQLAVSKLQLVGAYAPALSVTAQLAYNEALFAYQTLSSAAQSAVSAYNSINNYVENGNLSQGTTVISGKGVQTFKPQTLQQQYYQQFFGYWNSRTLFTIQTPWAIFEDMAIKSMKAVQSAETNTITDFEITFKQIRFATVLTDANLNTQNTSYSPLTQQAATEVNQGNSAVSPTNTVFPLNGVVSTTP